MPITQTFPLNSIWLTKPEPPLSEWVQLVKSEDELLRLLVAVQGIPTSWLRWVEDRVERAEGRGITIECPLAYRLTALWRGVVALQECKFLCDVFENALRHAILRWSLSLRLTYAHIDRVPDWHKLPASSQPIQTPVSAEFISQLSFGQLTAIADHNWLWCPAYNERRNFRQMQGFRHIFCGSRECADRNVFKSDMAFVRSARNDLAHCKRLFCTDETKKVFLLTSKWLMPLHVVLQDKIITYRNSRPNFLEEVTTANAD